ncbi:MAG: DUF4328 domain-containing protein [Nakamurella sp.]
MGSAPSRRSRPYLGPPSYGGAHPRWGFPPVIWRPGQVVDGGHVGRLSAPQLRTAGYLLLLTCALTVAAAGAETWRFLLLLRGRTEVLSGPVVAASDATVTIAGSLTTVSALITAAVLVPAFVRLHGEAARRAASEPGRPAASVLARLVVPGWNLYGVGLVAGEIDGLLTRPHGGGRPRISRLVLAWWMSWVTDGVLVLVALGRAFGRSEQAMADTVELHIAVDLVGGLVALLGFLVCQRFLRLLADSRSVLDGRWVVQPARPTGAIASVIGPAVDAKEVVESAAEVGVAEPAGAADIAGKPSVGFTEQPAAAGST